jgi:dGTPase
MVMKSDYGSDATEQEAFDAHRRLSALSAWPHYYDGTLRSLARLKDSTSQLIGRFVLAAEVETRRVHGDGSLSRYSANLEIPREQVVEVDFLKAIAGHYLINAAHSQDRYAKQQIIIGELVEMLTACAPKELDSIFIKAWNEAADESARMRVIIDQLLTEMPYFSRRDSSSLNIFVVLTGMTSSTGAALPQWRQWQGQCSRADRTTSTGSWS